MAGQQRAKCERVVAVVYRLISARTRNTTIILDGSVLDKQNAIKTYDKSGVIHLVGRSARVLSFDCLVAIDCVLVWSTVANITELDPNQELQIRF